MEIKEEATCGKLVQETQRGKEFGFSRWKSMLKGSEEKQELSTWKLWDGKGWL